MFGPEYARACGIEALEPLGVYLPGDKNYPGKHRDTVSHAQVGRRPSHAWASDVTLRLLLSQVGFCLIRSA